METGCLNLHSIVSEFCSALYYRLEFLARLASSLLEPRLCNSLTDDNDNDDNEKKAQNFEKKSKIKKAHIDKLAKKDKIAFLVISAFCHLRLLSFLASLAF